jgi:hypothetical protein
VKTELEQLLEVRQSDYQRHLGHLGGPRACACDIKASVRCHFVIADGSGQPRFRELARMLVNYITMYCFDALKRKVLSDVDRNALFTEARDLFRKAGNSGQVGEILIYFLLEAVLKAPQALHKMPLTTNPKEERKGSDGVHIRWDATDETLEIFFAESKIWGDFGDALRDALKSVRDLHADGIARHELKLFSGHFKVLDPKLQERVNSYIDGDNQCKTRIHHACLVGFDWEEYKCLDDSRRIEFVKEFEKRYEEWAQSAIGKVEAKLSAFPHKHLQFEFFFIPFSNVQSFRDYFEEALRG